MIPLSLSSPVSGLNRVGRMLSSRLKLLSIHTVQDLLYHVPFRYEDYSQILPIASLRPGMLVTTKGYIESIGGRQGFRKVRHITEAILTDGQAAVPIVWFNQPYLEQVLAPGQKIAVSGRVQMYRSLLTLVNPTYEKIHEKIKETLHTGALTAIYPLTANLTQKQIRFLVHQALAFVDEIPECLPEHILQRYDLPAISDALRAVHFPKDAGSLSASRKRLKFDELLLLQLQNARAKKEREQYHAQPIRIMLSDVQEFVESLPFTLTDAQKKVSWKILSEMKRDVPMNRLLQGDVGSGKTVVAMIASLNAIHNGYQVALMAPTEILAHQHFHIFEQFLGSQDISVGILTRSFAEVSKQTIRSSQKAKREALLQRIRDRTLACIIGTHALLEDDVLFPKLALVIVDEQHRFGVMQRKRLKHKMHEHDFFPHLLSMTATPIPRTLALTLYGDLSISVLDQMPQGRIPVQTHLLRESDRAQVYRLMASEIALGHQCYVICPLIEESDTLGLASVEKEYARLSGSVFQDVRIGLLHGKLKSKEKEAIMKDFASNIIKILVSTSVVEVGVDVPNATIMLIEGAERFGLAQLHQFRGRVGRSEYPSSCFLIAHDASRQSWQRLQVMTHSHDGFYLAQKDLEIRGPGEVFGQRQSGLPEFTIASFQDTELIEQTQLCAQELLKEDPLLEQYPVLREKVHEKVQKAHFE